MSDDDESTTKTLARIPSGVRGLDTILNGGFLRGGVYMILAQPGSGKTILGNQISFHHVAAGGRALVVTLLTESHARMIAQLQGFAFFDSSSIGAGLSYVAGYQALEKDKFKGLIGFLRKTIQDQQASLLVIDGLVTAGSMADSELETKKFLHELQVFVELVGCTALLLTGVGSSGEQYALRTMVDGLLELRTESVGMEAARTLEVKKFRGSRVLLGRHLFEINDSGIEIYPRRESRLTNPLVRSSPMPAYVAAFGVAGLDAMLGGGLHADSTTMIVGAPGSGKTLLGLNLLAAGAEKGEPGLYFGFFETPADIHRKAAAAGIDIRPWVKSGAIQLMWQSPLEAIADALAEKLLAAVRERRVQRVFIDGLGGFRETLVFPDRARRFFSALCHELRTLGVVTALSDELLPGGEILTLDAALLAIIDNVIRLQHLESGALRNRLIAVTKMRDGTGDYSLRQFSIDDDGFVVASAPWSGKSTLRMPRAKRAAHSSPVKKGKDGNRRRRR